jgi:hypothetical protein
MLPIAIISVIPVIPVISKTTTAAAATTLVIIVTVLMVVTVVIIISFVKIPGLLIATAALAAAFSRLIVILPSALSVLRRTCICWR